MNSEATVAGQVAATDLTDERLQQLKQFYGEVVGWDVEDVDLEAHGQYASQSPAGWSLANGAQAADVELSEAGQAEWPPAWLACVNVADLEQSMGRCRARGGRVVAQPRSVGPAKYCLIQDPAGAVVALFCRSS